MNTLWELQNSQQKEAKTPILECGACIVSNDNKILSIGYNGFPIGCSDDEISWEREGDFADTKYPYVCHAELNAILNYPGSSLKGSKIYVNQFPCNECAKAIIQSGIKEVIYKENKYPESNSTKASMKMFKLSNILYKQYDLKNKTIHITL